MAAEPARAALACALVLAAAACGPVAAGGGPGCRPVGAPVRLPADLAEPSGVAASVRHPGVLWMHNDAGSVLFAAAVDGTVAARFLVRPELRDWEDLAVAPCGEPGGSCVYAADLGDNYEERTGAAILRIAEPDPSGRDPARVDTLRAQVFPVRLPDGPRDIEALLVLPGERILVVSKGRRDPVTVYRYPGALRPDTVTLKEVQRLSGGPRILPRQVTGGAVAPGGALAALRTYESLQFYRVAADTLVAVEGGLVNLRPLQEPQGEGVAIGAEGLVALTSESGPMGTAGSLALLRCRLEEH